MGKDYLHKCTFSAIYTPKTGVCFVVYANFVGTNKRFCFVVVLSIAVFGKETLHDETPKQTSIWRQRLISTSGRTKKDPMAPIWCRHCWYTTAPMQLLISISTRHSSGRSEAHPPCVSPTHTHRRLSMRRLPRWTGSWLKCMPSWTPAATFHHHQQHRGCITLFNRPGGQGFYPVRP